MGSSQVNPTSDAPNFLKGRRLTVFGAGYIGSEVVERALAGGAGVTALTRNAERAEALVAIGAQVVVADLAAADAWRSRVPAAPDFVLNCVSSGGGGLQGYRQSYVGGMRAILDWGAAAPHPGHLVYTSSTSVYPQSGGVRVDEEAPTAGADERARVLLEAEALARRWRGAATVLRLAGIYGPGRHHLLDRLLDRLPMEASAGPAVPGRGDHRLNLIHREDAVAAIFAAFAAPVRAGGEIFNVTDDRPVPKAELVDWLARELGLPAPRFTGMAVPGRRAVPLDRVIDNGRIKRVLGWRPQYPTFREGYAEALRAALKEGRL